MTRKEWLNLAGKQVSDRVTRLQPWILPELGEKNEPITVEKALASLMGELYGLNSDVAMVIEALKEGS